MSCTWPNGASSFGTGWLFGPNDVATAAHVVYSQENGGYPSSIIFYPGVNNSGSIVGASYKATIAVLPATYQSERDETKDYAFLSLNYNYLLIKSERSSKPTSWEDVSIDKKYDTKDIYISSMGHLPEFIPF